MGPGSSCPARGAPADPSYAVAESAARPASVSLARDPLRGRRVVASSVAPPGDVGSGGGRRTDYAPVDRSDSSTCGMIWYTLPQPSVTTKSPSRATEAV